MINYSHTKKPSIARGFTIVELIVVIVVIAILAAVTIITYNIITDKALMASLDTVTHQMSKELKMHKVRFLTYPANVAAIENEDVKVMLTKVESDNDNIVNYISDGKDAACFSVTNVRIQYSVAWSATEDIVKGKVCSGGNLVDYDGGNVGGGGSSYDPAIHTAWTDPVTGKPWSYPIWNDNGTAKFSPTWTSYDGASGGYKARWSWDGTDPNTSAQQDHTTNAKGKTAAQLCAMMGDGQWRLPTDRAELLAAYTHGLRTASNIAGGTTATTDGEHIYPWTLELHPTSPAYTWYVDLARGEGQYTIKGNGAHVVCVR